MLKRAANGLRTGGADLLFLFLSAEESNNPDGMESEYRELAIKAAKDTDLPLWVCVSFTGLESLDLLESLIVQIAAAKADAICLISLSMDATEAALRTIRKYWHGTLGLSLWFEETQTNLSSRVMQQLKLWQDIAGLSIIGGCSTQIREDFTTLVERRKEEIPSMVKLAEIELLEILDYLDIVSMLQLGACSRLFFLLANDSSAQHPSVVTRTIYSHHEIALMFREIQSIPTLAIVFGTVQSNEDEAELISATSKFPRQMKVIYAETGTVEHGKNGVTSYIQSDREADADADATEPTAIASVMVSGSVLFLFSELFIFNYINPFPSTCILPF